MLALGHAFEGRQDEEEETPFGQDDRHPPKEEAERLAPGRVARRRETAEAGSEGGAEAQ